MNPNVVVVGMCGITCSGKTSLSQLLCKTFDNSQIIMMDTYFLPENDSRHVFAQEVGHINWEIKTSLDLDKMVQDVKESIKRLEESAKGVSLLIIDGFLVLNVEDLKSLCDIKVFVDIDYNVCLGRRSKRVYDPPDVPGYFEKVVWPESQKNKEVVLKSTPDLHLLDGGLPLVENVEILKEIIQDRIKSYNKDNR